VKLVLFQAMTGEVLPGVLTERGVVDIADAVPRGHTPQATMQGIIDGFDGLRPALERLANERDPLPLSDVRLRPPLPRPGKILACIANYWEHGALDARPLNMFLEASGAHAVLESDPIQRFHRDVHGASHHAALTWDPPAEQFGRQALGVGKSP
jgi:hypothetical protein